MTTTTVIAVGFFVVGGGVLRIGGNLNAFWLCL